MRSKNLEESTFIRLFSICSQFVFIFFTLGLLRLNLRCYISGSTGSNAPVDLTSLRFVDLLLSLALAMSERLLCFGYCTNFIWEPLRLVYVWRVFLRLLTACFNLRLNWLVLAVAVAILFLPIVDINLDEWLVGGVEQVVLVNMFDFVVKVVAYFGEGGHVQVR